MGLINADKLHYKKVLIRHEYSEKEAVVVFAKEIDKAEEIEAVPLRWITEYIWGADTHEEKRALRKMFMQWENENGRKTT